jgi:murein DD-endopeptidase MepM/ murein hydrolase activator NlpD
MKHVLMKGLLSLMLTLTLWPTPVITLAKSSAEGEEEPLELTSADVAKAEMPVLQQVERKTRVPWYFLAAVNQFERGIHWRKNKEERKTLPIQVEIPPEKWSGATNPQPEDHNPVTIQLFGGMGLDGNNDKKAERNNPIDAMYTMAKWLAKEGTDEQSIRLALWDYYRDGLIVDRITGFAHIFQQEGTTDVRGNSFPIPMRYNYSYRSTWGDPRGWGGRRIHEGCDIFADHGTPVVSTSYGVVEVIGWNKYGGWRIGIRDLNNVYHYYAHLRGFEKGLKHGSLVKPGQLIGAVGSSGYGKVGTSGKFAPHLHYGMYRESGTREWAFDPTPYLRKWEREMKNARTKKKKP